MLVGKNLTFSYSGQSNRRTILDDVSFEIHPGDFIGLIGVSGSGKTTFVKHLNGLLKASSGSLLYNGENVYAKNYPISNLRKAVGLVFQYPENQLFGKTVLLDTMYAPQNLGMSDAEAEAQARESLALVGIDEALYHHSPLELSGGQKRCVAIAGILAMNPQILVLDEPAAGLDPETKHMIFDVIAAIQRERNIAIVLVSHHMEDVVAYAKQVWVFDNGKIALCGSPEQIFTNVAELERLSIGIPQITEISKGFIEKGMPLKRVATSVSDAESLILEMLGMEAESHA